MKSIRLVSFIFFAALTSPSFCGDDWRSTERPINVNVDAALEEYYSAEQRPSDVPDERVRFVRSAYTNIATIFAGIAGILDHPQIADILENVEKITTGDQEKNNLLEKLFFMTEAPQPQQFFAMVRWLTDNFARDENQIFATSEVASAPPQFVGNGVHLHITFVAKGHPKLRKVMRSPGPMPKLLYLIFCLESYQHFWQELIRVLDQQRGSMPGAFIGHAWLRYYHSGSVDADSPIAADLLHRHSREFSGAMNLMVEAMDESISAGYRMRNAFANAHQARTNLTPLQVAELRRLAQEWRDAHQRVNAAMQAIRALAQAIADQLPRGPQVAQFSVDRDNDGTIMHFATHTANDAAYGVLGTGLKRAKIASLLQSIRGNLSKPEYASVMEWMMNEFEGAWSAGKFRDLTELERDILVAWRAISPQSRKAFLSQPGLHQAFRRLLARYLELFLGDQDRWFSYCPGSPGILNVLAFLLNRAIYIFRYGGPEGGITVEAILLGTTPLHLFDNQIHTGFFPAELLTTIPLAPPNTAAAAAAAAAGPLPYDPNQHAPLSGGLPTHYFNWGSRQ